VHLSPQFRAERHGRTTNLANETPASFVAEGLYRLRKNEFETSQGTRSFHVKNSLHVDVPEGHFVPIL